MGFPALASQGQQLAAGGQNGELLVLSKSMRGQDLVIARVEISNLLDNLVERKRFQ